MGESKYWWAFIDMWGNVEYQYGTFLEACDKADTSCLVTVTKVEWYEEKK